MASFRGPPPISVVLLSSVGIALVLLCFASSVKSEVWRDPSGASYVYNPDPNSSSNNYYPNYDQAYYRRTSDSEEEIMDSPNHRRRSATDSHGRSVLFKSLVLAPLALVVFFLLVLLVIPIPVVNGVGRSLSTSVSAYSSTLQMIRDVMVAEECVERVSCELSRVSRAYDMTWIPTSIEKILTRNKWGERIVKGFQRTPDSNSNHCSQYTCNAAKNFKRSLRIK